MPFPQGARFAQEYTPAATYGGFHAAYIPGGDLTITAKIKLSWQNDNGPWDPLKQAPFRSKLLSSVPKTWNDKWKFRCRAAGFGNVVATPKFNLQIVDNGEHFHFICHNKHGQAYLHAGTNAVHLFENDVRAIDKQDGPRTVGMSSGGVMAAERRKVEEILAGVGNITVTRANGPWAVADVSAGALNEFANQVKRLDPDSPRYPLIVEATSGLANKANEMVDTVITFLRRRQVDYPITRSPIITSKKFKNIFTHTPKPTGTVTIRLSDDSVATRSSWFYRYKVAVHEFGHCLGLPDEYQDHYPTLGTTAHDAWRDLCRDAGVPARPVPKFDASIMSCGWQTYACHYVTVWDALCQLTRDHVAATDWVIERGSQGDYL